MDDQPDSISWIAIILAVPMWYVFMKVITRSPAFCWWGQVMLITMWLGFIVALPAGFIVYYLYYEKWTDALLSMLVLPLSYITVVCCGLWIKSLWTSRAEATKWWEPLS